MDELDVRICRALVTNYDTSPYSTPLKSSIREVARRLQVDHLTVSIRIKRLQEKGFLAGWKVLPNPSLFGYRMVLLLIDIPRRSLKQDMMRKLRLIHGVVLLGDFIGDSLAVSLLHDNEQSLSRTVELISRITNAENVTRVRVSFPPGEWKRFTEMDLAIVRSLESDAMKSYVQVAKEIGVTPKTVKNRLTRLKLGHALSIVPHFDIANVEGMIGLILFYSYTSREMKSAVDRAMLSHFDGSCLWATLSDPERSYLILVAPTVMSVKSYLGWAGQQPGVAGAEIHVASESVNLWSKASELFRPEETSQVPQRAVATTSGTD